MKKVLIVLFFLLTIAAIAAHYAGFVDVRKILNKDTPELSKSTQASATLPALPSSAGLEKRVALVIGNAEYQNGGQLSNTVNDASDIAAALQQYHFEVILKTNANLQEMTDAIDEFGEKLKNGGVGLFFYSGHGIQVKGENYLVPVDGVLKKESDVKRHMINANEVLEKMGEGKTHLNLVFLDACRDNPFPSFSRSMSKGLGKMDAPSGTLIAYATSPNDTASDGSGRNSPYTSSLLNVLKTEPTTEIGLLLRKVTKAVKEVTKGDQEPWLSMSIDGEFYFAQPEMKPGTTPAPLSAKIQPDSIETSESSGIVAEKTTATAEPETVPAEPPAIKDQSITGIADSHQHDSDLNKAESTANDDGWTRSDADKNHDGWHKPDSQPQPRGYVCHVDPNGDNFLSLRAAPQSAAAEILRMKEHTAFVVLEVKGAWYRIQLNNGMTGWAFNRWLCLSE